MIYIILLNNKIQLTNETILKYPNSGTYLLPLWRIVFSDRNGNGKQNNFIKSTKTSSPTNDSGATSLSPIGNAFMYIETSGNNNNLNNNGNNVFVSFTRTDIIQITNITFYYDRFSISDENLRAMGRFRIQLLLENDIWTTQYTIAKNTQYSDNSTDWSLLNIDFTVENYGIKLVYDQIEGAHADMFFSKITITHSVY